MRTWHCKFTFN